MNNNMKYLADEVNSILGTDISPFIECGLITSLSARKWLVKKHYKKMYNEDRTLTSIKNELSVRYNLSVSLIEKLVYTKI